MYSCEIRPRPGDAGSTVYVVDVGAPALSSKDGQISGLVTIAEFITTTVGYADEDKQIVVIMATSWNNLGEEVIRKLKEIASDKYVNGVRYVTRLASIKFEPMRLLIADDTTAGSQLGLPGSGWANLNPDSPHKDVLDKP